MLITDPQQAKDALTDPNLVKDPAFAPPHLAGLEPTAAEQMSVTTLDGPPHQELRKAFTPLFNAKRMRDAYPRMLAIAHELLDDAGPDLAEDFTSRYPLAVLCDLLGIPRSQLGKAILACTTMNHALFDELAEAALEARVLAARMSAHATEKDLRYQVFTLLFAGQITTDIASGYVIARLLGDPEAPQDTDALIKDTLHRYPPARYTLWRFDKDTREPVRVDIEAVNRAGGDLSFGAGPHYCLGAQLALQELRALVETIRTHYPDARLARPFGELPRCSPDGIMRDRLVSLPVRLS